MSADELLERLRELRISQTELARMLGVTNRAVSLWLSSDRKVPGPVVAFLAAFALVPDGKFALLRPEKKRGV